MIQAEYELLKKEYEQALKLQRRNIAMELDLYSSSEKIDWEITDLYEDMSNQQDKYTRALTSQRLYISSELDSIESAPYMNEVDTMELNNENDIESEYSTAYIASMDIITLTSEIAYFENQKKQFSSFQSTAIRTHHDDLAEHYNRLRKICIVTLKALKLYFI